MNFIHKCNGISMDKALTPEAREVVAERFPGAMAKFRAFIAESPTYDAREGVDHTQQRYLGRRCTLDGVIARLTGFDILGYHAIYGNVEAWVLDALRDCASADYWYTFEKEW